MHLTTQATVLAVASACAVCAAAEPPAAIQVDKSIPYGCIAFSPSRRLAACVVGSRGRGVGTVQASVSFVGLGPDVDVPAPITILDAEEGELALPSSGEVPLSPPIRAELIAALRGFSRWSPIAELAPGPAMAMSAKGVRLRVSQRRTFKGGDNAPPRYDATVDIQAKGRTEVLDSVKDEPLSEYRVRVYDTPLGLVVEREAHFADEGRYYTWVDAWSCAEARCERL